MLMLILGTHRYIGTHSLLAVLQMEVYIQHAWSLHGEPSDHAALDQFVYLKLTC